MTRTRTCHSPTHATVVSAITPCSPCAVFTEMRGMEAAGRIARNAAGASRWNVRLSCHERIQFREAGKPAEVRADALREVRAGDSPGGRRIPDAGTRLFL